MQLIFIVGELISESPGELSTQKPDLLIWVDLSGYQVKGSGDGDHRPKCLPCDNVDAKK
jgi:hypothetical protein